ncbi:MAG: molybdopterin molybdenumtransferase MoeA, partial [Dehalococcoidaceae bacterium]|nr:molybdopterin molybdenumtransferase MoeA [Dehalococcoidaceae bacterium]
MLSVDQAQKKILAKIKVLPVKQTSLLECLNQVLAKDILSKIDVPLRNNSSMDGYAIKAQDTKGLSKQGVVLDVIGENQAGSIFKKEIKSGQAVRIMTGSVIPKGANAVVPFEDTDEYMRKNPTKKIPEKVEVYKAIKVNENIRKAAEDTKKGAKILNKNTLLNPAHIGLAASVGIESLPVIRKATIAIISSGNEIIRPPQKIKPG